MVWLKKTNAEIGRDELLYIYCICFKIVFEMSLRTNTPNALCKGNPVGIMGLTLSLGVCAVALRAMATWRATIVSHLSQARTIPVHHNDARAGL